MVPADNIFATIRGGGRVWAVGSVHGEAQRLAAMHALVESRFQPDDKIVFLGNYFGHGADVRRTVDTLLLFRRAILARPGAGCRDVVFLRGAQEEMWRKLLQLHIAPNPRQVLEWMLAQGVGATIAAYGGSATEGLAAAGDGATAIARWTATLRSAMHAADGHVQLMSALRHAAYTDDNALLFVNAGIDPARPLSAQSDSFWWSMNTFAQVVEPYAGFKRVVRGFSRLEKGVQIDAHTATIDAGAGLGGRLAAALFDADGTLVDTAEA